MAANSFVKNNVMPKIKYTHVQRIWSEYLVLSALTLLMLLWPKGYWELQFNLFEWPALFPLFNALTQLGDGWWLAIFLVGMLLVPKRHFKDKKQLIWGFVAAALVSIIAVTLLKQVVFKGAPRPILFFSEVLPNHWSPELFQIRFNKLNSFPSGHTTTAAVLGLYSMKLIKSRVWCHSCYLFIWLVGISRIFLFQHFIVDVIAGILLAFISVFTSEIIIYTIFSKSKARTEVPQISTM